MYIESLLDIKLLNQLLLSKKLPHQNLPKNLKKGHLVLRPGSGIKLSNIACT